MRDNVPMASATLIPLSQYLNTTYRPDCDYIDGELRERTLGEQPHSALQAYFVATFAIHRVTWGVRALPEQRVQTSATHYRIADICVRHLTDPADPIIKVPPLLCIEILSRRDTLSEMQERIDDYSAMGVGHLWVIDPMRRIAYLGSPAGFQRIVGELTIPGTPICFALEDLFHELDTL